MAQDIKIKILFLCTGNSCRSQMAEGWAKHLKSDFIEAHSAGIVSHGLNPLAVQVMAEAGVDISMHRSQILSEFSDVDFDYVITMCSHANETCPVFPARIKVLHKGFDDPPALAKKLENPEEILKQYCRVRDEIRAYIETFPASLQE